MKGIHKAAVFLALIAGLASAQTAEFFSYPLLKDADVPGYDEWRFVFSVDSYTFDNFTPGYTWHESVYSVSLEFGFWTFSFGDLSVGGRIPFYFWYARDQLKKDNSTIPGAKTKVTGFMDPEIFGDLKIDLATHLAGLVHGLISLPNVAKRADEGGAGIGQTRGEIMAGIMFEYKRLIFKVLGGWEAAGELGNTPPVYINYRTPALFVPQVQAWDNTTVAKWYADLIFCTTATSGFGIEYFYRGSYFKEGKWSRAYGKAIPATIADTSILTIKLVFASTAGGFAGAEKGTIFTIGIGFGGVGTEEDLNPDTVYTLSVSKYF